MAPTVPAFHIGAMQPDQSGPEAITIARADAHEAAAIAAVHVAVWRNAYPGILPDHTLAGLSQRRLAAQYEAAIRHGACVLVARAAAQPDMPSRPEAAPRVVGFATASPAGPGAPAQGEVETLYVLDDWREQGIGRLLLRHAARHLAHRSCRSLFLWVLADNPSRWFYQHLGGRAAMGSLVQVGGRTLPQIAMVWDRIDELAPND